MEFPLTQASLELDRRIFNTVHYRNMFIPFAGRNCKVDQ